MKQVINWLTTNILTEGSSLFPHSNVDSVAEELFSTWDAIRPYEGKLEHYRAIRGNRATNRVSQ